jgi:predicted negative regulator of RcsB-dependent stress response
MSQLSPANQPAPGAKTAETPAGAPGLEVAAQEFWVRNRNFILLVIIAAVLVIAGREGWAWFSASREADLQADFAKAGGNDDRLAAFADAHAGHALAGVASLRVADDKFTAGDFKAAAASYTKAAASLTDEALIGRARLGTAVSQVNGGDQAAGEAALKALSDDTTAFKAARAEAAYHLASLALGAGRTEDARKYAGKVDSIDATGPWAQRAAVLLAGLPATSAPVAAATATATTPAASGAAPMFSLKPADTTAKPATPGKP